MNLEETVNQAPVQTFEQILEMLYREHKRLEVEYRKLYEYRRLENEYRSAEDIKKQEELNKIVEEYRKLAVEYQGLEAEFKTLEDKHGAEGQYRKQETDEMFDAFRKLEGEYKSLQEAHKTLEEKHTALEGAHIQLEEEYANAEQYRKQEKDTLIEEYRRLTDDHKNLETRHKKLEEEYHRIEGEYQTLLEHRKNTGDERTDAENSEAAEKLRVLAESYRQLESEHNASVLNARVAAEERKDLEEKLKSLEMKNTKLEIEYKMLLAAPAADSPSKRDDEYKNLKAEFRKLDRMYRRLMSDYKRVGIMRRSEEHMRDVSEAEKELQHFYNRLLLQSCSEVIFVVDRQTRVVLATDTMNNMLGISGRSSVINNTLENLFASRISNGRMTEILQNCRTVFETSAPIHYTRVLDLHGGKEMTADITMAPAIDKNGEVHAVVFVVHDITELDNARKRAEEASRSKSSFLATVSHEIRTPLNAILGISEIEIQKELATETMDNLEKIYSSGSWLLSIINDILDISKIEAGSMEIVPTNYDTSGLISSSIQLNLVRRGNKKIELELDIDPSTPSRLNGDELRVKQILNNLLSNAFKYTEEGFVKLGLAWEREDRFARLKFVVSDSGQGIRKEEIGKLFTEYKQLNARANRNIEGTGLGLSITQRLVELMGGSISVESEFGKGSTFTVNILQEIVDESPMGDASVTNLKEFRFAEYRNRRRKNLIRSYMPYGCVLVVDDVLTNLEVAKGLLLPYGLTIDCVASGREAIEKIKAAGVSGTRRYDLVLMDHMMPEMDGIEATHIIRGEIGSDYARNVPIVALTASAMAGSEKMFLENGFNSYISKPIDIMRLDVELNKWIRDKRGQETLAGAERPSQAGVASPGAEDYQRTETNDSSSAPAREPKEAHIPGIDLEEGLSRYGDDDVFIKVLRTYADSTPQLLDKMRIISRYKMPEYAITVHGIKGSSYGICAQAAGKWAERLEAAAKHEDLETLLAENNDFIKMMERLLSDIRAYLDGPSNRKAAKTKSYAPDRKILETILTASKMFDVQAMEKGVEKLEEYEYASGADLVAWLRSCLDNLEYAEIQSHLTKALQVSRRR
ncbi:MAG: response regulator [Synergistaceae bacterium]|jgi:PAS domain S-box-containing protein|nr:response regulator [Synergistaceae bacterium]